MMFWLTTMIEVLLVQVFFLSFFIIIVGLPSKTSGFQCSVNAQAARIRISNQLVRKECSTYSNLLRVPPSGSATVNRWNQKFVRSASEFSNEFGSRKSGTLRAVETMGAWVPVGSISCLSGLGPTEIEIMGQKLVVWEKPSEDGDKSGSWSILTNSCPHRLVPLSYGRIDPVSKCIECPYHGWQFDSNGTLTKIPHLEPGKSLMVEQRSVQSFPVHETGDILWVFLPTSFHGESFPKSLLPEQYYAGLQESVERKEKLYSQEMPYSYDFLGENIMDAPAHAHFAHHSWSFFRSEALPLPAKVVISNFTNLEIETSYERNGQTRQRRFCLQRPFYFHNKEPTSNGKDWRTRFIFFAVPVKEGASRIILNFKVSSNSAAPDWLNHLLTQKFLEGDLLVHDAEIISRKDKHQPLNPNYVLATSSDTPGNAWRSWWMKYGMTSSPPHSFGSASPESLSRLDRKDLVDPWRVHTSKCTKCQKVLSRSKIARNFGLMLLWCAACLVRRRSLALVFGSLGLTTSLLATRLIRELEGVPLKSQVSPRCKSTE